MIQFSVEDYNKLVLLDKIFTELTLDDIIALPVAQGATVGALISDNSSSGVLLKLVSDAQISKSETEMLRAEINVLKADVTTIIKTLAKPYNTDSSYEFNNLKMRHSIY